ncbi:MAG: hypothetical protein KGS61_04555 [Verrucomicrobia bacterium]|nr:hypothetical protein [Verrucomicrobiota bacterium]
MRSISMNQFVGQIRSVSTSRADTVERFRGTTYQFYHRDADFRKLSPARAWIFPDERPDDDIIANFFPVMPPVPSLGIGAWVGGKAAGQLS